jgi:NSS family neurotransmitter:Na+ symporter
MICGFDTMIALLAGLAIFPAVFHFSAVEGIDTSTLNLNGIMLMFETLPKVFESIGYIGNIIEFFFFTMVVIAAITSVISIIEVASQFVIQKFKISRKIATVVIASLTFAVSVPVNISLGHLLSGVDKMTIFGLDWLSFLDTVTNTVFMPVCAFFSCVAVGWFIGAKQSINELKADGNQFGKLEGFVAVMMKFVAPALIAVIEIFGIIDLIFPSGVFSANGLGIVLVSYALFGVLIAVYFLFIKNKDTGTNADELK